MSGFLKSLGRKSRISIHTSPESGNFASDVADESAKSRQKDNEGVTRYFNRFRRKPRGASASSTTLVSSHEEERCGLFVLYPEASEDVLYSMDSAEIDVVAIHGLNGDAWKTWTDETSGHMWLKDFLPSAIPNARIMTFGYDSSFAFNNSLTNIDDFAIDLLVRLRGLRDSTKARKRPLLFICHSLGGIVAKKALILAHESEIYYGEILQCCSGILFMGTPHRGSNIATWGRLLSQIANVVTLSSTVRTDLLKNLETSSVVLKSISGQFVQRGKNLQIISFFERVLTSPLSTLVVQGDSAVMGVPNERAVPIDADHRSMCRFSSRTSQKYKPVEHGVLELVANALETTQKSPDQPALTPHTGLISTSTTDLGRFKIGSTATETTQTEHRVNNVFERVVRSIPEIAGRHQEIKKPATLDVNPDSFLGGHTITITVKGVKQYHKELIKLALPSDTLVEDLPRVIRTQAGVGDCRFELRLVGQEETISSWWEDIFTTPVVVAAGKSCFRNSNELRINLNETLASFFSKVHPAPLEVELFPQPTSSSPGRHVFSEKISVGSGKQKDLDICLMRTVRVPDNGGEYQLPPSLGKFPLFNIKTFENRLPPEMVSKGGIFFPIYLMPESLILKVLAEREAMWINFDPLTEKRFVIRPFVGGVNGISGRPASGGMIELLQEMNDLTKKQDYVVLPEQPWLDGIATSPGSVKQFVATPMLSPEQNTIRKIFINQQKASTATEVPDLGSSKHYEIGASIELQVTGEDSVGGIQLEIIPEFNAESIFFSRTRNLSKRGSSNDRLAILKTPDEIGVRVGEVIHMKDMGNLKPGRKKLLKDLWNEVSEYQSCMSVLKLEACHCYPMGITELTDHSRSFLRARRVVRMPYPAYGDTSRFNVLNFDGKILSFEAKAMTVRQLKHEIYSKTGTPIQKQVLMQRGKVLTDDHQLDMHGDKNFDVYLREESPAALTVGAGGKISQNIEADTNNPRIWDVSNRKILNIQLVNSASFEEITGFPTPPTPIDSKTYASLGLPFYDIYQERPSLISGSFGGVKTLSQIDAQRECQPSFVYDALNPPICNICRQSLADSLFRPCDHCACKACADTVRGGAEKCPDCQQEIERVIGVSASMGSPGEEGLSLNIPVVLLGAVEGSTFQSIVPED